MNVFLPLERAMSTKLPQQVLVIMDQNIDAIPIFLTRDNLRRRTVYGSILDVSRSSATRNIGGVQCLIIFPQRILNCRKGTYRHNRNTKHLVH